MFIRVDFSDPTDAERLADRIVRLMRGFAAGFVVSIHDYPTSGKPCPTCGDVVRVK